MTPTGSRSTAHGRPVRIAVLWNRLSGYLHAQLDALVARGAEVIVFHPGSSTDAPFDVETKTAGTTAAGSISAHEWSRRPDERHLASLLDMFEPDAILVSSWNIGGYRRVARRMRGRTLRILCMDNQWWGTAKQWAGVVAAPLVIRPTYDAVLVAGDRQAQFARRIGFSTEQMMWGLYTANGKPFSLVASERLGAAPAEAFLFVGRLVPDKAIDVLAEGYRRYRARVGTPWPLIVAGTGPEEHLLTGIDGVERLGFVQPSELPGVLARGGCLVLPSRFEPWAVVIHEAAYAQLPIVCTWVCGASTRLVLDGYNGVVISPDDPDALAGALVRIGTASDEDRVAMGQASGLLAQQNSPGHWAERLLRRIPDLRARIGLPTSQALSDVVSPSDQQSPLL